MSAHPSPPFDTPPELVHVPTEIRTDRLVIRPWTQDDAGAVFEAVVASRETLRPWMPWADAATDVDDQRVTFAGMEANWIRRSDLPLGVLDHDGAVLGGSGLHRMDWKLRSFEIGYWLTTAAVGHGYMTECVAAVTRVAFEVLDATRVEIKMDSRNERSRAIPERLGFQLEGTLRGETLGVDDTPRDTLVFSLIRGDALPPADLAGNPTWS